MSFKMRGVQWQDGKKFAVKESSIHGMGAIATKNIKKGELVGMAVTDEKALEPTQAHLWRDARTKLGKYLNHKNKENASFKSENNTLNIYAKNTINKGEEITVNYKKGSNYVDGDLTGYNT